MTASSSSAVSADPIPVAVRSLHAMADGDRADFDLLYHPHVVDRENQVQPPSSRVPGPAGVYATALWLRAAFSGLRFEIHEAVERDDLVVFHVTMSGRHTGDFVTYQPDTTTVDAAMPPAGKPFAITQTHWFRTRDGRITEHWANRDDLAMARQAGWIPPSPRFLLRAALAKRRAQKHPA
jgi:predicted ester cyclase